MPHTFKSEERLSFVLSREMADEIRRLADEEQTSVASLIRRALRLLLAAKQ